MNEAEERIKHIIQIYALDLMEYNVADRMAIIQREDRVDEFLRQRNSFYTSLKYMPDWAIMELNYRLTEVHIEMLREEIINDNTRN